MLKYKHILQHLKKTYSEIRLETRYINTRVTFIIKDQIFHWTKQSSTYSKTTMQLCKNYVNLKHCKGQKFNVKFIKATHRRSNVSKTLVSQEIFANLGLRKFVLKFPEFLICKMLFVLLQKILSMLEWEWRRHFTTFLCTCII